MEAKPNPLKRSFEEFSSSNPETDATDTDNTIVPRECDLKAYEVAINRNTIAVMESGTGKPVIALMMIKEIGKSLAGDNGDRKLIIFLAPTVRLVHQQYKEIKSYTGLDVEEYFGAKGVDDWNAGTWEKEIKDHDVLVMTPQIFLDALRKVFISFELFCFIVIDECHQATGNHPYAKIMKEYYSKSTNKPKILGMTASPVIRKGISSIQDYEDQVRELEYLLDSQVYIVEESTQLDKCVPSAKRTFRFYDAPHTLNLELKTKLTSIKSKFLGLLECLNSLPSLCIEADNKHKSLLDRLVDNHENILSCLDSLGVVCAQEAIKLCLESALMIQDECEVYKESIAQYQNYLREAMSILKGPSDSKKFLDVGSGAVACGQISSKLHELLEIFRSLSKDTEVLCIIFVERIITAKVIARVMDKIIDFSHFNVAYLAGSNSSVGGPSEVKTGVLESLCGGKVNLLFTMDVVEEEIDASKCSTVIRFDLPKTVQSYVKSRGQARQKDSQYIIMLERGNCDQINHISYITQSENSTINAPMNREPNDRSVKARVAKETGVAKGTHTYVVDSTGASVSATSSLSLIHRYCNKLQEDKNLFQRPIYEQLMEGNLFRCKLILPPNAAFQTITGPAAPIFHLSKQLVCLDACKKLHSLGALDDHLVPLDRKPSQDNSSSNTEALTSGPGSTKRKELHGSVAVRIMSGTWGDKLDGAIFYAYKMDFVCNIAAVKYSSFVLLLEAKLDDDVGNIEVELYLLSKFVKASISFCGQISLDAEQMAGAKCFQELIFNGLFGKLFVKFSGVRKFLFQTEEVLWNPSCMYLLLPVETMDEGNLMINWTGIQSCVSSVEFLRKNAWLHNRKPESSDWNLLADASDSVITEVDSNVNPSAGASDSVITEVDSNVIHLANQSVAVDSLKEMVVIAIHTGRIYSVLKAVANSSAESPFDGEDKDYLSFADYYHRKYGIVLKWPGQPLLLLKQSHNAHNYLVDFRDEGLSLNTKSGGKARKPQQRAHMPPELLIGTNLRTDVFKSVYLLPSVMHRLESLMLASQLREEISRHTGCVNVPSSLILEALTTLRCCERFSMERLELLGDSVLKYAVSCNLFLKNPKEHEGLLSSQRSRIICNASLHKLGTDRKLQEYIRDTSFDPRRWAAPGHRSIWPSPCTHGLDTMEVPLENKYFSEDIQLLIGKACDKGHRWMGSKTISDCVEALIGAYYVGGGLVAAIDVLKWLGIEAEFDPSLVEDAIKAASLYSYAPKTEDISALEVKLAYEFSTKGLLLEAITHETKTGLGVNYCYERLEFLGDAVLDLLITRYLYDNHKNLDPGDLTDLRSASVNNDNFAIVSVRRNLHPHLLLTSPSLESQISAFVKLVSSLNATVLPPDTKAPKLLGDLVESIAGAVLIDSKLNVKEVWRVFEPLLSPIVTPEKLELPPSRELIELCDSLGYFIKEQFIAKGGTVYGELKLQLEDVLLEGQGSGPTRKAAKGMASLQILKKLESRGISLSSKRRKLDNENVEGDGDLSNNATPENLLGSADTRHKPLESPVGSEQACDSSKVDIPVVPPIETKKGGPRNSLYALCRKLQWPMPTFETSEQKFRTPIQLGDTAGFNSFESKISLIIPGVGKIETKGEARADKKSSFDSAALLMLTELERQGKIVITAA